MIMWVKGDIKTENYFVNNRTQLVVIYLFIYFYHYPASNHWPFQFSFLVPNATYYPWFLIIFLFEYVSRAAN